MDILKFARQWKLAGQNLGPNPLERLHGMTVIPQYKISSYVIDQWVRDLEELEKRNSAWQRQVEEQGKLIDKLEAENESIGRALGEAAYSVFELSLRPYPNVVSKMKASDLSEFKSGLDQHVTWLEEARARLIKDLNEVVAENTKLRNSLNQIKKVVSDE